MSEPLYGLTARTADRVRQLLADGGEVGGRASSAPQARGVTWVKVTSSADADGWHGAVPTQHMADAWQDGTLSVLIAAPDGRDLVGGNRYLATRTGDDDGGTPRYRAVPTGPADPNACRDSLANLDPATDRVTFQITPGTVTGRCAEIAAKSLTGYAPDPDIEQWVSIGTFPTKLGHTSLTYRYDADTGEPVLLLTATTGEGSGATTVIQPMMWVGCVGGCGEYVARPLLWCDSEPVTDCEDCPDGAPRRWRFTLAGGTGDFASANGEYTVVHTTDCTWVGTLGDWTATVTTSGGTLSALQVTDGAASAQWVGELTCCAPWSPELDDVSSETGTPPDPPTVTPLGPCVKSRCATGAFKARVCCKGHTRYTGCDALPAYFGAWCLTGGTSDGVTAERGTLIGNYGPALWGPAGGYPGSMFSCPAGPAHDYDDTRWVCGWNFYDPSNAAIAPILSAAGVYSVGAEPQIIKVLVYYDPTAESGAGAWVLAQLRCFGAFGSCDGCYLTTIATAANDPDPADDPFEIVFRLAETYPTSGVYYELRLTPGSCEEDPACDDEPCFDGPGGPLAGHPDQSLTVVDGTWAGTFTLAWAGSYWTGMGESAAIEWRLSCAGGVWTLERRRFGVLVATGTATAASCDPYGLVFAPMGGGGSSDITAELAT